MFKKFNLIEIISQHNILTVKNASIFLICYLLLLPNISLIWVGLNIWNYKRIDALVTEVYTEKVYFASKGGGGETIVLQERLCYIVDNKKYTKSMRNFYRDSQGDTVTIFVNTKNPNGIIARGRFEILWALKKLLLYICIFTIIFIRIFELYNERKYKLQLEIKHMVDVQKQKDIEEILGRRDNICKEDNTFFDKMCINNLGRSIPAEIDWILRYGDLSKLDDSFLFKENNGVYGFITETLYLRKKGLSEDYLVFQIFDNKFRAINFDDKKVYSFKAGEYEEAVLHGTFLNYLKQQLIP